ncbi:uncharacterized protein LOC113466726 [Diaphorina citri]|uniref:Uncharacterized protein LOC113466726 n=1 Tax=Diaphorina citri TaxID=121845 RepID=A0A3Q0IPH4_DIACI|nr:uncharacterized protein LOC113466726 [Diaphorina citri]
MESMHTDDMKDVSDTDEESEKAMIEQIKRDSLKQLEEAEKVTSVYEDPNVSTTDIFYQGDDARGFFLSSGETYIYPTNYPIRDYQRNIVQSCLFENTHPKPKLPQTTSVLSKLSYVEENGINNTDINTNPPIVSKPANTKNTVNDTSSDEDLEFFIPKRNRL